MGNGWEWGMGSGQDNKLELIDIDNKITPNQPYKHFLEGQKAVLRK